jgi:hypothetical protein
MKRSRMGWIGEQQDRVRRWHRKADRRGCRRSGFHRKSEGISLRIQLWTAHHSLRPGKRLGVREQAGRRVALAIAIDPLLLFSKKRKHFLTIAWKDEQSQQHAAVFELGKSIIKNTIATLEARTGKKVDYLDDEARKSGQG